MIRCSKQIAFLFESKREDRVTRDPGKALRLFAIVLTLRKIPPAPQHPGFHRFLIVRRRRSLAANVHRSSSLTTSASGCNSGEVPEAFSPHRTCARVCVHNGCAPKTQALPKTCRYVMACADDVGKTADFKFVDEKLHAQPLSLSYFVLQR